MNRLPLRCSLSRGAHWNSFFGPVSLLANLHSVAQPPEVGGPSELLRAHIVSVAPGN